MKRFLKLTAILTVLSVLFSCTEKEAIVEEFPEPSYVTLHGLWKTVEMNGIPFPEDIYVYRDFNRKDHSFTEYSNYNTMYPQVCTGYFTIAEDPDLGHVISGSYDLKGDWQGEYVISGMTGDAMLWTRIGDGQTQKLVRCDALPEDISGKE